jgi:hypothetical protein
VILRLLWCLTYWTVEIYNSSLVDDLQTGWSKYLSIVAPSIGQPQSIRALLHRALRRWTTSICWAWRRQTRHGRVLEDDLLTCLGYIWCWNIMGACWFASCIGCTSRWSRVYVLINRIFGVHAVYGQTTSSS